MIFYLDSSAILRWVFKSPGYYRAFGRWERAVSSVLADVECNRALDRLRLDGTLNDVDLTDARAQLNLVMDSIELLGIDDEVVAYAKQAFPVNIRAMDALHIASAFIIRRETGSKVKVVTHDERMILLARNLGLGLV